MGDEESLPTVLEPETERAPELERIFRENHAKVFATAYRITGNAADAEDVLQSVFLHLARRPSGAAPLQKLDGYLRRAAVNGALDVLRARRGVPLDALPQGALRDAAPDPEASLETAELRARLRRSLARLSPQTSEVFTLRYIEGFRNLEIARMLGMSTGLVAFRLFRARRHLGKELRSSVGGLP